MDTFTETKIINLNSKDALLRVIQPFYHDVYFYINGLLKDEDRYSRKIYTVFKMHKYHLVFIISMCIIIIFKIPNWCYSIYI